MPACEEHCTTPTKGYIQLFLLEVHLEGGTGKNVFELVKF